MGSDHHEEFSQGAYVLVKAHHEANRIDRIVRSDALEHNDTQVFSLVVQVASIDGYHSE